MANLVAIEALAILRAVSSSDHTCHSIQDSHLLLLPLLGILVHSGELPEGLCTPTTGTHTSFVLVFLSGHPCAARAANMA